MISCFSMGYHDLCYNMTFYMVFSCCILCVSGVRVRVDDLLFVSVCLLVSVLVKFFGDEFELSLFVVFPLPCIRRITVVNSSYSDKLLGCC